MKSLNLCQFIGNLGRDVETRYTASGTAVTTFSIAVADDYKDKDGQKVDKTEWVRCVAYGKLGEICGQYLKKGSKVYVAGRMETRKFQDKQTGADRYSTEILLNDMQMLDSRSESQESPRSRPAAAPAPAQAADDFADPDIPF
jgi:single-strand DNA-binding protein